MILHKANAGNVSVGGLCSEREMRIGLTMRQPLIEDGSRQSKRRDGGSNRCWWQSRGEVVSLALHKKSPLRSRNAVHLREFEFQST